MARSPTGSQAHHRLPGVRCLAKGADEALRELHDALDAADLLDTHVLVTRSACLYPCNRAPVMCVQPDMKWVGPVTSDTIDDVMRLVRSTGERRNACGYEPGRN
ncbi:NADH:ubiquinone oxidoreductase [Corynebacterium diphtheriae]|nr:NADH:ubiquinone oxidoreductase [Corynebacterium diphtheriae]